MQHAEGIKENEYPPHTIRAERCTAQFEELGPDLDGEYLFMRQYWLDPGAPCCVFSRHPRQEALLLMPRVGNIIGYSNASTKPLLLKVIRRIHGFSADQDRNRRHNT